MTKRSPAAVIILTLITFFIYQIVWSVKTKREMVSHGADIPTCWLMIVPIAHIYWMWKFAGGVEHVTQGKMSQAVGFMVLFLLGMSGLSFIGMAIIQSSLNQAIDRGGLPGQLPQARVA